MRFAIAALAMACACGVPDRIVIDEDSELVDVTRQALCDLEVWAGCPFGIDVVVGGRLIDWVTEYPPPGTVTLERGSLPNDWLEVERGTIVLERSRVTVADDGMEPKYVAHGLLHAIGEKHGYIGVMRPRIDGPVDLVSLLDETPDSVRDSVRRWCLED